MTAHIPEVAVPDPLLKTSPIIDEDEEVSLQMEQQGAVCYFNDVAYPIGQYVRCRDEVLHCEEWGVWVRQSEIRP